MANLKENLRKKSNKIMKKETLRQQIDKLAKFLLKNYEGEFKNEGAVDMAIRLLKKSPKK